MKRSVPVNTLFNTKSIDVITDNSIRTILNGVADRNDYFAFCNNKPNIAITFTVSQESSGGE